jgi:hypothetical protein
MRKTTIAIAAIGVLLATPAIARGKLEVAVVKAATDCVAAAARENPKIGELSRRLSTLKKITNEILLSDACKNQLEAMRLLHDKLYGRGTGRVFLLGDYRDDLPRAVQERLTVVAKDTPEEKEESRHRKQ